MTVITRVALTETEPTKTNSAINQIAEYIDTNAATWAASRRTLLAADLTLYVDVTNGSDSNLGTSAGAGNAWKTIQHAVNAVCNTYDLGGNNITIQLADGTYPESVSLLPYVGRAGQGHNGPVLIKGNSSNSSAVIVSPAAGNCFTTVEAYFEWDIQYIKMVSTAAAIYADFGAWVSISNVVFGACTAQHIVAVGGMVEITGPYTINGNSTYHILVGSKGNILYATSLTVTLTGTPAFTAFLLATNLAFGTIQSTNVTFSGAATGQRYNVSTNSVIDTGGAGATFLPGNAVGVTATGGLYV